MFNRVGCISLPMLNYLCVPNAKKNLTVKSKNQPIRTLFTLESFFMNLSHFYQTSLCPLEEAYHFHDLISPKIESEEFSYVPTLLFVGPTSSGKTTAIRHLLNYEYKSMRIGPESTTNNFNVIVYGEEDRVIPGNILVTDNRRGYKYLSFLGNTFIDRLQCIECDSTILKRVNIIDTPGTIFSATEDAGRFFLYKKAIEWFCNKSDQIIFMFDSQKINFSTQELEILKMLIPYNFKLRIVLNKAEIFNCQQLMRVYGSFMWNLSQIFLHQDTIRVHLCSFVATMCDNSKFSRVIEEEQNELLKEIRNIPKAALMRKISDFIKRAHLAIINAYIVSYMKQETTLFNEDETKIYLLSHLPDIYKELCNKYHLNISDFPDIQKMKNLLKKYKFSRLNKLDSKMIDRVKDLMSIHMPEIIDQIHTLTLINDSRLKLEGGIYDTYIWKEFETEDNLPPRYDEINS